MSRLLCFVLFLSCYASFAQIDLNGQILDGKTQEPLPYVNIGIVGKGLGTVTDEDGLFYLDLDISTFEETDLVQISSLGYETITISVGQITSSGDEFPRFLMKPADIMLDEVVLSSDALVPISEFLGYRNYGEQNYAYWNKNIALGGELSTKIKARQGRRQLNSLELEVWENPSDSVLIRINIYDTGGFLGRPGLNLNTVQKNILYTLPAGRNIVTVDLNPYDLYVDDDFFVSLELLKVYGNQKLGLVLAASGSEGSSFRKYASQSEWEFLSDLHMAYYLETSPYVTQKKASRYEAKVERARAKKETLSGFAIFRGQMIPGVTVHNERTKETVITDETGRYIIEAEKRDIILFTKKGYQKMFLEVQDQKFANAIMKVDNSRR